MKRKILIPFLLILSACASTRVTEEKKQTETSMIIAGKMFHSAFIQNAAEYRALTLQAYNYARLSLDEYLRNASGSKPIGIITDIDETLLDNSSYTVHQGLQGKDFDLDSWTDWTSRSGADTIPGAVSFMHYAKSRGVAIFYITNRGERERHGTLENLRKFGFPDADSSHLLMRESSSSKEERRQRVVSRYDIALLLGDNLADFTFLFDKKSFEERRSAVDALSGEFGRKFIIIPNAAYGDWESAMYRYLKLSPVQKDSVIRTILKSY